MNAEQIEALVAVIGLLFSLLTWLWRTSASTTKAHVSLGVVLSDVGGLKNKVQHLRDSKVAHDTVLQMVTSQMRKVERKIDTLQNSSSEIARSLAVVAQLAEKVVPREELQAKFDAVTIDFE